MALSGVTTLLLLSLVLSTQALEPQKPMRRRSKRDFMASMTSFFTNFDKRLTALEARLDNNTEQRLARLEAGVEGDIQGKLQDMQGAFQRLESMMLELMGSRLESMVTQILEAKRKTSQQKAAEPVEARSNGTEERLEPSSPQPQACRYQYLYRYGKEAPHSSRDLRRLSQLESQVAGLQEKVSALDRRQQDSGLSASSLHNASLQAVDGLVLSVTELVAASEQRLLSVMQNATETLASQVSDVKDEMKEQVRNATAILISTGENTRLQLLAKSDDNLAAVNNSLAWVEHTTAELATRMSAVESKVENSTSLDATEMQNMKAMHEDLKEIVKERCPPRKNRTCQDFYDRGITTSGVYKLNLEDGQGLMEVYCNMDGGKGWVVFQRREDGSVDFYRDWKSYKEGFGDLEGEFWLGNENIHRLTRAGLTQLRVDLQAWDSSTAFALFSDFRVGSQSTSYRLSVSGYSGTAGDSLALHSGQKFSTFDRDQDAYSGNCAKDNRGAWWYKDCHHSNLNGEYGARGSSDGKYVVWGRWLGSQSLQRTELKLK